MSNAQKIYDLLEAGKPMTSAELAKASGLALRVVQDTLGSLRDRGSVQPHPVTYTLSAKGEALLARRREQAQEERPATTSQKVIRSALSHRHALDQCWGAGA